MDLEPLLALQELDTRIAQLGHRQTHDPVLAQLTAAIAAVADVERRELELFGERDVVRQELKRLEDEAATTEAKIAKVDATLYGGTVTSPKELESLQHEMAMLRQRLAEFEDLELEQMELAEPLEARATELAATKTELLAAVADAEMAVTVMHAEVGAELDDVTSRRQAAAGALDPDLLARYDRIRAAAGGIGAARLAAGGLCEGCHLTLPRAEYDAIRHAPADEIHTCPECGRILVRS